MEGEVVVVREGVGEDLEGEEVFAEVEEVGEEEEEDSIDSRYMKDFETCSFRSDIDDLSGKTKMPELDGKIMDNTSNRKAMNRNWGNQKANPALKPKTGNKKILHTDKIQ